VAAYGMAINAISPYILYYIILYYLILYYIIYSTAVAARFKFKHHQKGASPISKYGKAFEEPWN
jgi:hypothetical protein